MNRSEVEIRKASIEDLSAIVKIYNEAITDGSCTADTVHISAKEKEQWFHSLNNDDYGIYISILENEIAGYFYFSPWRTGRSALKHTVELSFYIGRKYRGRGLGDIILEESLQLAKKKGIEHLMAILLDVNLKSKTLLEKHNFVISGHLKNIAKFGNETTCGQFIMLKDLRHL